MFPRTPLLHDPGERDVRHDVPGRRRAGSVSWAGLGNVHYWIDPASGIAGVWATQLLPFFDPAASEAFESFERAVYRVLTDECRT